MIGKNIEKIRKKWKLKQPEFGAIFNISKDQVSSYETGRAKPKVAFLIELQRVTGINLKDLWTRRLNEDLITPSPIYDETDTPPDIMEDPELAYIRELRPLDSFLQDLETRISSLEARFDDQEEKNGGSSGEHEYETNDD